MDEELWWSCPNQDCRPVAFPPDPTTSFEEEGRVMYLCSGCNGVFRREQYKRVPKPSDA
jgi:hypothetical protein